MKTSSSEYVVLKKTFSFGSLRTLILVVTLCVFSTFTSWSLELNNPRGSYPLFHYARLLNLSLVSELHLNDSGKLAYEEFKKGKFSEARILINRSLQELEDNENTSFYINTLILKAMVSFRNGDSIQALQNLHDAYKLNSVHSSVHSDQSLLTVIGGIHQARNEHTIALEYLDSAIDKKHEYSSENELAFIQMLRITSLISTRNTAKADGALLNLMAIIEKAGINEAYPYFLQFKGELDFQNDLIAQSIDNYEAAVKVADPENLTQLANLYLLMSKSHAHAGNLDKAVDELVQAFSFAGQSVPSFYFYQTLQLHRAYLLSQMDEFEAAFNVTRDLFNEDNKHKSVEEIETMLDMHANFQLNIQKQENILLKENNRMQALQLENKKTLNQVYFILIALLVCLSALLLLLFLRTKKHQKALLQVAHTDSLTGLYSRSRVLELLEHHTNLFNRNNAIFSVAIVDLDYFKKINDTYGHFIGDKVLAEFGNICKRTLRKTDIVGRIGGEEFLILFPNTTLENAQDVCNLLNRKLPDIGSSLNLSIKTTASIGLASPLKNEATMDVVKRSDSALYEAKSQGRNRIVVRNSISSIEGQYKTVV